MRRSGFTLVEVLVGVAILLVGFVPVYLFLFRAEKSSVETQRTVEALLHAETLLEEIARLPYAAIPAPGKRQDEADYKGLVRNEYRALFAGDGIAKDAGFARSVETHEADGAKRIKVYVVDRRVEAGSAGRRGELFLSTLVMR